MQAKIIELKQAPVVLVELSERPVEVKDSYANGFIYKDKTGYIESEYLEDYCDWEDSKLVGILSDLTEDQFAECVPFKNIVSPFPCNCCGYDVDCYRNFVEQTLEDWEDNPVVDRCYSRKESFYTLLESEKVYTESQAFLDMHDPKYYDEPYDGTGFYQEIYSSDIVDWKEVQSRTIDPTRTVVLIKSK